MFELVWVLDFVVAGFYCIVFFFTGFLSGFSWRFVCFFCVCCVVSGVHCAFFWVVWCVFEVRVVFSQKIYKKSMSLVCYFGPIAQLG